ncbi:MAG: GGDEF and EAL domain-containing protein [Anaerolineaceae bacterium]|nr:GGDEF and EAL domain-containing protein [Anaerolineaceae bacterium]
MHQFSYETRKALEAMPIPLAYYQIVDEKITLVLVSDGLCKMRNRTREEIMGQINTGTFDNVHPEDIEHLTRSIKEFSLHLAPFDIVYRVKYEENKEYHTIHSIGRFQPTDDGSDLALLTYIDVSDSGSASRQIADNYEILQKDRFYTDSLTGLPNLNYLLEFGTEKVQNIRESGDSPALVYFDVIGLRSYNLQYGFAKGDELLKLIADMLKAVYPGDTIVRGADDHFIVLRTYANVHIAAEKITELNEKIKAGADGNTSGVQAGICIMEANMNIQDAMDHAKHAMQQIGNDLNITHVYYTHETDEAYWNQRYILETFDEALKNEWIKVYYQAIQRIRTGNAAALEALARWVDPLRGIISPAEFIPVLEKYHMLYKLDLYMVDQICKEVPKRQAVGLPIIPVTVNFSAQDFDHTDVLKKLDAIFEKHGLTKDHIEIEITEQDLAKATEHFKKQINDMRQSGYRIWIDDFGSGYSSLNIFSQFKVNVVKFDIEFLRHLDDNNGANRHIMKAMIEVFRKMGIASLAEGVETEEQMEFLKAIGCEFAQGFYYYKPQSLGEIIFKIEKGSTIIKCETHEEMVQIIKEWDSIR